MLERAPRVATVYEVGPRDGLQNEATIVPAEEKVRLIGALADAGLTHIEVGSFVGPKWIPTLADTDEVARRLSRRPGVTYSALVPNEKGLDRALAAGVFGEVAVFLSASETHNQKNVNATVAQSLAGYRAVVRRAREAGLRARAYVSCVWGCPYEGSVAPEAVRRLVGELLGMGVYQVSLGDTIGVGTPRQTEELLVLLLGDTPADMLAMHMHDTRGTALANVLVGLAMGIGTFDSSVGGLGGCPYAPGASGNLATEDLVYMLAGMGVETGVDQEKLVEAGLLAERLVGHPLPGRALQAAVGTRKRRKR